MREMTPGQTLKWLAAVRAFWVAANVMSSCAAVSDPTR